MSLLSKQEYELINLGVCIKQQAERLGIEHDGVPLEGVVVRIAERALSVVAEEPEWEYAVSEKNGQIRGQFDGSRSRPAVEAWWAERRDLHDRGCHLVRRRKAGPWVPVKQDEDQATKHEIRRQPPVKQEGAETDA